MSKRRRSTNGATPETRDQALRLAVAATTLGMTMGITPATVFGADEAPAPGESPSQVQEPRAPGPKTGGAYMKFDDVKGESSARTPATRTQKFEKIERPDAASHKSAQGAAASAGASPNASFRKDEQPAAGTFKGGKPPVAAQKGDAPEAAAQQAGKTPGAGGPKYDVATTKK